ncbi:hypothetical protein JOF56_010928 [Kibdelosporangium banguiense]|uniref:Carrier domain-containing protein n=1 Tax=Kibdelosporangium banguiense TaxID=1365924 RepID=A0ABS4U1L2_9PSEU|nr:condensation domain-containing protein [Kibdelosporangium banguiense]MBP2330543.1 hypothetical protein [Kibdelosporangium banguiense]
MTGKITRSAPDRIPVLPRTGAPLPVSPAQRALYLVEQLYPGTSMHNVPVAVQFDGPLDVPRLETSIGRVLERHEALRTTFPPEPESHQQIMPPVVDLPVTELDEVPARQQIQDWANEPFDLADGPLTRTRLIRLGPERHVLVVVMHQLITDGPSIQLFFDELADAYAGKDDRAPLSVRLADHASWQLGRPPAAEDLQWWRDRLTGVPTVLRLPTDGPRPQVASTKGANHFHTLPAAVMTPSLGLARQLRVTPFVLMLTAYAALLARLSGATDVLVGIPVSTRDRVELETVIGFFVTTLPVRVDTSGDPGFGELVQRVQDELLDVLGHQEVTFDRLVTELAPERDPAHPPLVQAFFSFEAAPIAEPSLAGTSATTIECPPDEAKVDIDMTIFRAAPDSDDFRMTLTYRKDLFGITAIERFAERFEQLLATADLRTPLSESPAFAGIVTPAIPAPAQPQAHVPAHTDLERGLSRIWQDVLGLAEIGRHDNFFDLGGTSFALATVQGRIRELTGTAPPLVALLEFPTVATLAEHLTGASVDTAPEPDRLLAGRDRLRQRRRVVRRRETQ